VALGEGHQERKSDMRTSERSLSILTGHLASGF